MRNDPNAIPAPLKYSSLPDESVDTAVTITIPGEAGQTHVLVSVEWSYSLGTPVGKLQIKDGSTLLKEVDVNGVGHWPWDFSNDGPAGGLPMTEGADLVATLTAGGALVQGKINITYR